MAAAHRAQRGDRPRPAPQAPVRAAGTVLLRWLRGRPGSQRGGAGGDPRRAARGARRDETALLARPPAGRTAARGRPAVRRHRLGTGHDRTRRHRRHPARARAAARASRGPVMNRPLDEDEIRALFQEVNAPPGVGRWRHATQAREPEPVYIPPSHRERRPPVRRRRTGLAVAASAFAVAALVGAVPVVVNAMTSPSTPAAAGSTRPSTSQPTASPSPAGYASASPSTAATGSTRAPGGTASAPASQPPTWPDAKTTGVPAGKTLRTHTGDLVITTAGTVIDGLLVTGSIIVQAPDVTIRNTRVSPPHTAYWLIRQTPGATNLDIENSELVGNGVHIGVNM